MFYNRREVLNAADSETVANALGIPVKQNGRLKQILCPGHLTYFGKPDMQYGNCVLTEKGYHCFACNRTVNMFDMVMEVKGCSFHDAIEFVAGLSGKEFHNVQEYRKPIFSKEELELIGITCFNKSYAIKKEVLKGEVENIINKHDLHRFKLSDNEYGLLEAEKVKYSLYELEMEDFDTFYEMLRGKMKEAVDKRNEIISQVDKIQEGNKLYSYKDGIIKQYLNEISQIKKMALKLIEKRQKMKTSKKAS